MSFRLHTLCAILVVTHRVTSESTFSSWNLVSENVATVVYTAQKARSQYVMHVHNYLKQR